MGIAEIVAERRQASKEAVAAGAGPLVRMSGPVLERVDSWHRGANASAPELEQWFLGTGEHLVFRDWKEMNAKAREMSRRGTSRRVTAAVSYMAKLGWASTVVVLTEALKTKFWGPADMDLDDFEAWLKILRLQDGEAAVGRHEAVTEALMLTARI